MREREEKKSGGKGREREECMEGEGERRKSRRGENSVAREGERGER